MKLKLPVLIATVAVYSSPAQIATQQAIAEEHQCVLGIFPNFYVTYDTDPVPFPTKLKFRLAYKAGTDVVTFAGVAFMAAIYQAGDIPNYGQGWDAYGKRVAAGYADSTTDIFIGADALPWLFHQDPRYFYQSTGKEVPRLPCNLKSICLWGRQQGATAKLLELRRRSRLRSHFELLLSEVQPRRGDWCSRDSW
jgi:hypothetical protein